MNDENESSKISCQLGQGRKPFGDLTNAIKRPPAVPPTKVPVSDAELKLVRKLLQEREKQVIQLTQQLSISEARSDDLLQENNKHKNFLQESRRQLASQETILRRKSVELTSTSKLLHAFVNRNVDQKIRRSQMERKELEAELERLECDFEQQLVAMNDVRLMLEEAASKRVTELTDVITRTGIQTTDLSTENALLKEQQEEWKKTVDTMQSKLEDLTSRLSSASQELSEERTRRQVQQHELDELRQKHAVQEAQLSYVTDEMEQRHKEGTKISTSSSSSELWNSIRLLKQTESQLQREIQSLQHQLTITREEVQHKLDALGEATVNYARLEGAMVMEVNRKIHLEALHAQAEEQLMIARDEYRTLHGTYSKLKIDHVGLVKQLATLTVERDQYQQQQQQSLIDYSELQHMHNILKTSLQQHEIQISVLQSVIDVQNQGLADVRHKYDSFRGETGTIEETNKQLRQDLTLSLMENTRQQKELLDLQQQQIHAVTIANELQSCRDCLATKTHEINASKTSIARLESQIRTEEAKVVELMKQREDSFQQVNHQDKLHMLDNLKQQIQDLVNDNRRLRKEIEK